MIWLRCMHAEMCVYIYPRTDIYIYVDFYENQKQKGDAMHNLLGIYETQNSNKRISVIFFFFIFNRHVCRNKQRLFLIIFPYVI